MNNTDFPLHYSNEILKNLRFLYKNCEAVVARTHILNTLGLIYLEQNKNFPACLCFSESLRLNPIQGDIAKLIRNLKLLSSKVEKYSFSPVKYKVSVIVPTCGRLHELRECIRSIIGQTFKDLEIIVFNDAGDESVKAVIDSFDNVNIKYKRSPVRVGPSAARNEGIRMSEGEYIAFLDDDDIYYEQHLMVLVCFLDNNPDFSVAYTNSNYVHGIIDDNIFKPVSYKEYDRRPKDNFDKESLVNANYISTLNIMLRRNCLPEVVWFNEQLTKYEDWDLWLRLAISNKFKQLNEITGEYRFKENNVTITDSDEMIFWFPIIRNYYLNFCGEIQLAKHYEILNNNDVLKQSLSIIQKKYSTYYKHAQTLESLIPFMKHFESESFKNEIMSDLIRLGFDKYILACVREPYLLLSSRHILKNILNN